MSSNVGSGRLRAWVDAATLTDEQLAERGIWKSEDEDTGEVASVTRVVFPGFEHLPYFDMRNGDVSDARPLLVRPTIPAGYHWVPVDGVAPEDALAAVDLYIMSALCQLESNPPAETTAAVRRKMAIVLGTSRAVMTKHYSLGYGDFIESELAAAVINARARADRRDLALTSEEKAVVATLFSSSLGVLPVQGYSLMMTGHHYIGESSSQSRRAFAVIEKQFWNHNAVKNWFAADIAVIQDCAWHKSGHPVTLSIKESTACDERIAAMLREAGVGSAASRLPAMEPQLRAASCYLALMKKVDPLFKMFGGSADPTQLSEMFRIIKSWPRTTTGPVDVPETWPQSLETRAQALTWLGEMLAKNAAKVAYCYGFYCALEEKNQGTPSALRTSSSLTKLKRQCHGAYIEGLLAYDDYNAAVNKKKLEEQKNGSRILSISHKKETIF